MGNPAVIGVPLFVVGSIALGLQQVGFVSAAGGGAPLAIIMLATGFGTLLGYFGCWVLANYEIIQLPKDVFYVKTLPVIIYWENFLMVAAASMGICLLATIYPARQAANLAPVEVIRYE